MSYQRDVMLDRYVQAALSVGGLQQPLLSDCALHLSYLDAKRAKPMHDDHLKQEAIKWARKRK